MEDTKVWSDEGTVLPQDRGRVRCISWGLAGTREQQGKPKLEV